MNDSIRISEAGKRKGVAAGVQAVVLTVFLLITVAGFLNLVVSSNLREYKILTEETNVMYTTGFGSLLKYSLTVSWQTIVTQALFRNLDSHFGMPEYLYSNFDPAALPNLTVGTNGCNGQLCLPDANRSSYVLSQSISAITLPNKFDTIISRRPPLSDISFSTDVGSGARNLRVAADALVGRIIQPLNVELSSLDAKISGNYILSPTVSANVNRLLGAAMESVAAATQIRADVIYSKILTPETVKDTRGQVSAKLTRAFGVYFNNVRSVAGTSGSLERAHNDIKPTWTWNETAIKLGYNVAVIVNDEPSLIVRGLISPTSQTCMYPSSDETARLRKISLYNKYSGVIEQAQPDQLVQWVEQPRALLAAIAQTLTDWDPRFYDSVSGRVGIFGVAGGSSEPHANAVDAVAKLKTALSFESPASESTLVRNALSKYGASGNEINTIMSWYSIWKTCLTITDKYVVNEQNTANPNRIMGPSDYVRFLTAKNNDEVKISQGDGFCSSTDFQARGTYYLAYDFYGDTTNWRIFPAYNGKIIKIQKGGTLAWDGCGDGVWVQTGDFIISYGHISLSSSLQVGMDVDQTTLLGNRPYQASPLQGLCQHPHLQVMIYSPTWIVPQPTAPETYTACGDYSNCLYIQPEGGQAAPGIIVNAIDTSMFFRHCAAFEWEGLFREDRSGSFWRLRERNEWELAPAVLDFKMTDIFTSVDCSVEGEGRHRWLNENDLLCFDGKLWSCNNDAPSANKVVAGSTKGTYRCVEKTFLYDPLASELKLKQYGQFMAGKHVTKWCKEGEYNNDWLCCTGSGKNFGCAVQNGQGYNTDGETLVCSGLGQCT